MELPSTVRSDVQAIIGTVLRGANAAYHVLELIGEGGQGWVFRASYDDPDGFPVVVKVLRPEASSDEATDRFLRETAILRKLASVNPSPFIVRFFDHGEAAIGREDDGGAPARVPFTVLEYVHGASLQQVLDETRGAGLAISRARRIAREVGKALAIVHAHGVVHRDLKPSNILLSSEGGREIAKVTDFGISKLLDVRATSTQSLAGVSLSYSPPEQYEPGNPRVGPATDVFAFSAIVFELLSGAVAFPASKTNPFEVLRLVTTAPRPSLAAHAEYLPAELAARPDAIARIDALLGRGLAPDPKDRPSTIEALWEPIEAALREVEGTRDSAAKQAPIAPLPPTQRSEHTVAAISPRHVAAPAPPLPARRAVDAFDPRGWSWRVLGTMPATIVRDAVLALDDAVLLTNAGVVVGWSNAWRAAPAIPGVAPSEPRGVARSVDGRVVVCGAAGLLAVLVDDRWELRRYPDRDVAFHAVAVDEARIFAVGERPSRGHGFAAELLPTGWTRALELADVAPLRSVALVDRTAYACGDAGALVAIDAGVTRIAWAKSGHLRAIAANAVRVAAVGTGGHALAIEGSEARIERVTTTRDLLGVCLDDSIAWAVSANARVLRRDAGGTWRRVTGELPVARDLVRVAARGGRACVLAVDGTLLEGLAR